MLKDSDTRDDWIIRLEHGQPLRFGADGSQGGRARAEIGALRIEDDVAEDDPRVVVHDAHADDPSYAFALSRLSSVDSRYAPMGVFRSVQRPTYDRLMTAQLTAASAAAASDDAALDALLHGADTWSRRRSDPRPSARRTARPDLRSLVLPAVGAVPALLAAARARRHRWRSLRSEWCGRWSSC